jgi:hypothetical protein
MRLALHLAAERCSLAAEKMELVAVNLPQMAGEMAQATVLPIRSKLTLLLAELGADPILA